MRASTVTERSRSGTDIGPGEEICHLVYDEICRAGYERVLNSGVVLTGGSAGLEGLAEVADRIFVQHAAPSPVSLGDLRVLRRSDWGIGRQISDGERID